MLELEELVDGLVAFAGDATRVARIRRLIGGRLVAEGFRVRGHRVSIRGGKHREA
ncbi:hypothetical protein [Saccharopolyspora halophila]|uniref:hypothetical protein n=1 Tax=Saccharopolyspora halophila TaxID=405551 RepID=UPI0031D52A1F